MTSLTPAAGTGHSLAPEQRGITAGLLLVLALLSALSTFATDLYLPAFPDMMDSLTVSPTQPSATTGLKGSI